MKQELIEITEDITANGYTIPLGPVNLVLAVTDNGIVACGAINGDGLDKFELPTATMSGVSSVEELLDKPVQKINQSAEDAGITIGMTGREALKTLG